MQNLFKKKDFLIRLHKLTRLRMTKLHLIMLVYVFIMSLISLPTLADKSMETKVKIILKWVYLKVRIFKHVLIFSVNKTGYVYSVKHFPKIYYSPNFNNKAPTVLFIHGFLNDRYSYPPEKIVEAYEMKKGYNILLCDWGAYSKDLYLLGVIPSLQEVAIIIATHLGRFFDKGYKPCKFHLVGHSLGEFFNYKSAEKNLISNIILRSSSKRIDCKNFKEKKS